MVADLRLFTRLVALSAALMDQRFNGVVNEEVSTKGLTN